jgi:hypothetical protein
MMKYHNVFKLLWVDIFKLYHVFFCIYNLLACLVWYSLIFNVTILILVSKMTSQQSRQLVSFITVCVAIRAYFYEVELQLCSNFTDSTAIAFLKKKKWSPFLY